MVKAHQNIFHKRIVTLTVLLFFIFTIIVYRLFTIQVLSAKDYRQLAEDQYTLIKKLTAVRGEIKIIDKYSTEPDPVATSVEKDIAYAIPSKITDPAAFAKAVAPILQISEADILAKLDDKSKQYSPLKKQISEEEKKQLQDLHLTGLGFDPEIIRYYPEGSLLAQVLGYVGYKGNDKVGRYGLEQSFNDELAGQPGSITQEKDATGAWIFGAKRDIKPATNGSNLILTIDKTIQFKAESILKDTVTKHGADSGSIMVMDPKTGAILAMATYPTFDPNDYGKAKDPNVYNNMNTIGNYEPGSIFKAITMAASVNEGKVSPDSTYVDTGEVKIAGYTIKNSDNKAHGVQTMTQVLEESLNTGAIYAKEQIGDSKFLEYVKKFGFGKSTGIELPETKGDLGNLSSNISINFDTATFGQGLTVTPIQMIEAYGAFANGGKMMKPYIVQSKITPDGKVTNTSPQDAGRPITAKTASTVSAMLVNVVEFGHGKKAAVPGYYVAGKTGTAQVPRSDGRGYEPNNNIGSFIGFAPVEDPKFVAMVRINHPRDVTFAESSAAPAFGQLAQFLLSYMNVAPTRAVPPKK